MKPTQIERLVEMIEYKLKNRTPHKPAPIKRVSEIMNDCRQEIVDRAVSSIATRRNARESEVREGLPELLSALIVGLKPGFEDKGFLQGAAHGAFRRETGSSIDNLLEEFRPLERGVYEVVQENLLAADVSNLVPDLRVLNDHVQDVLRHAINAYLAHSVAA